MPILLTLKTKIPKKLGLSRRKKKEFKKFINGAKTSNPYSYAQFMGKELSEKEEREITVSYFRMLYRAMMYFKYNQKTYKGGVLREIFV